ncbi:MAG: hypothetical protein BV459_03895 [Thermoplasmata archaeon M11B2D]|nr:MAG: hypothetical protein BV459_03895 [Thermoplasmata archaeon M11B2D]
MDEKTLEGLITAIYDDKTLRFRYLWVRSTNDGKYIYCTRKNKFAYMVDPVKNPIVFARMPIGMMGKLDTLLRDFNIDWSDKSGRFITVASISISNTMEDVISGIGISICKANENFNKNEGKYFAVVDLAIRIHCDTANETFDKELRSRVMQKYWHDKISLEKTKKEKRSHWKFLRKIANCQLK